MSEAGVVNSTPSTTPDCSAAKRPPRRSAYGRRAEPPKNLPAEPEGTQLQSLEIVERLHLAPEPAAHADTGISRHERLHAEWRVEFVPERLPASVFHPGHVL